MILEIDHSHPNTDQPGPINHKPPKDFEDTSRTLTILKSMLQNSQQKLEEDEIDAIISKQLFQEQKVYLSYSDTPNNYLEHLLDRNSSETRDHVSLLLKSSQKYIQKGVKNNLYKLNINQPTNFKIMKRQLMDKINDIKSDMQNVSSIQQQDKQGQLYDNYMEFRRKGYWHQKNDKSQHAKQLLKKMNEAKFRLRKVHQTEMKKRQEVEQKELEKLKQQEQKERRQKIAKSVEKNLQMNRQRKKQMSQHQQRKGQIKKFLSQVMKEKPLYVEKQQQFLKEFVQPKQQQRRRKLEKIKKQHRPISPTEMQQHQRKYQQARQKLLQVNVKRQQQLQSFQRNQSELRQLFRGHYHQHIEQQMKGYQKAQTQRKKYREKIHQYRSNIIQNFKPKVDPKKQKELQQLIQKHQIQQDKSKVKKVKSDGTVVYEKRDSYNPQLIGNSYLSVLKKMNEGKVRKNPQQRSASMLELDKKPKIDYLKDLKQSRSNANGKPKLSGWKKVLDQGGLTTKDVFDSVMGKVAIMEHQARQKQLQLKNPNTNKDKSLQIKDELDQYYLQSVAAKMVVLKDVILKD